MQDDVVKPPAEQDARPSSPPELAPRPIVDVAPPPAAEQSSQVAEKPAEENPEPAQSEQQTEKSPKAQKPKSRLPGRVITVTAIVFIGLVTAAVYVTMSSKKEEPAPRTQLTAEQQSAAKVDELKKASEEADALPEANPDINPEITDQALGL